MNNYQYKNQKDLPIFFKEKWLDIVCTKKNWQMLNETTTLGSVVRMPLYITRKYFTKIISNPALTPYQGIYVAKVDGETEEAIQQAIQSIINRIPRSVFQQSFLPSFTALSSFKAKQFKNTNKYTYIIDTSESEEKLWANLDAKTRNTIQKASGLVKCIEENNSNTFNELNAMSFHAKGMDLPYDVSIIDSLFEQFYGSGNLKILSAVDSENNVHASVLFAIDQAYVYCLAIGSNPELKSSGAISYIIWEGIKMAQVLNLDFDFEGSMIPNIESFFRSFGGIQIPYLKISKIRNPIFEFILSQFFKINTN